METKTYRVIFLVTAALLLIGVFDLPYGYYMFLRLAVSVAAVFLIVRAVKTDQSAWNFLGGAVLLVFFPLFGITHEKGVWAVIDLAFAVGFLFAGLKLAKD